MQAQDSLALYKSTPCDARCARKLDFEITMAFQPIVDAESHRIHGYEALVRGLEGEGAGVILARVDQDSLYAFDQACRQKAIELAARLGLDRRLSINFLPNAVYHPEACLRVTLEASRKHGFPLDLITFEFTENEHIRDTDHLKAIIETYRAHAFETALDDFGAGYANLALLAEVQTDSVKLDRALIDGIADSEARQAIVEGLLVTLKRLGIAATAEGVERAEDYATLRRLGVTRFQGYLFARPQFESLTRDADIFWP